jgi:hypothetical protein
LSGGPVKSDPRPASSGFHRTCPVSHRTSPVKALLNDSFEVGGYK